MMEAYGKFFKKHYGSLLIVCNRLSVSGKQIETVLDLPFIEGNKEILLAMTL